MKKTTQRKRIVVLKLEASSNRTRLINNRKIYVPYSKRDFFRINL